MQRSGKFVKMILAAHIVSFIYTVEFKELVAVLHAFQKKSKSGIATPKYETDLIKKRLELAQSLYK